MLKPAYNIRTSLTLALLLLFIHLGAIYIILVMNMHWLLKMLAMFVAGYSLLSNLQRHAWRTSKKAIRHFRLSDSSDWILVTRNGESFSCQLNNNSVVTRHLALFNTY